MIFRKFNSSLIFIWVFCKSIKKFISIYHLTLYGFCLYYLLPIKNVNNNQKQRHMNLLLLFMLALIALSSYACGHIFSFKERYKEWYPKLFQNGVKPAQWNLSRQTNHDRYKLIHRVQLAVIIVFLVTSLLCLESITISLGRYFITLAVAALLPEILGIHFGKLQCDKNVRMECERCKIDIPELWKNPQGFPWRFFWLFMFNKP